MNNGLLAVNNRGDSRCEDIPFVVEQLNQMQAMMDELSIEKYGASLIGFVLGFLFSFFSVIKTDKEVFSVWEREREGRGSRPLIFDFHED